MIEAGLPAAIAQHRAELASANQLHDRIATEGDPAGLRAALLEQASAQREANEDVAEHISALTSIIADLGQTVGMLAVAAAHKAQHSGLPTRPTFTPPPRSEPAAAAPHVPSARSAALPQVDPVGVTASRIEPASSRVEPTAPTSSALPPAAANRDRGPADLSLSHAITHEPAHRRPIHLRLAQEAAERTRVQEALEGDLDDVLQALQHAREAEQLAELAADTGVGENEFVARVSKDSAATTGQTVSLACDPTKLYVFDAASGINLIRPRATA